MIDEIVRPSTTTRTLYRKEIIFWRRTFCLHADEIFSADRWSVRAAPSAKYHTWSNIFYDIFYLMKCVTPPITDIII